MRIFFVFLFLGIHAFTLDAQSNMYELQQLKRWLSRADTLNAFSEDKNNGLAAIEEANEKIQRNLRRILLSPALRKQDPRRLLSHPFLHITGSPDGKFWTFQWYENNGGSWAMYSTMFWYRPANGPARIHYITSSTEEPGLCGNSAVYHHIYTLTAAKKSLYLCVGDGKSCNTCSFSVAAVVDMSHDDFSFQYPAYTHDQSSCYTLEYRLGDLHRFLFHPKTKILDIDYDTDDLTPEGEVPKRKVHRSFRFQNGFFVGNL